MVQIPPVTGFGINNANDGTSPTLVLYSGSGSSADIVDLSDASGNSLGYVAYDGSFNLNAGIQSWTMYPTVAQSQRTNPSPTGPNDLIQYADLMYYAGYLTAGAKAYNGWTNTLESNSGWYAPSAVVTVPPSGSLLVTYGSRMKMNTPVDSSTSAYAQYGFDYQYADGSGYVGVNGDTACHVQPSSNTSASSFVACSSAQRLGMLIPGASVLIRAQYRAYNGQATFDSSWMHIVPTM